ncbi:Hsp70 family protein [Phaeosphaeria sp. MPI-PUGE-AT-0046c]|nr:Hsp70 family protein [Phaeosphaeria sp. MPI-PUGE-AT-0046c]
MKSNRLVVGLDYGTTYTGVSYCETSDTDALGKEVEVVRDFPSARTQIGTKEKVPSEIAVDDYAQWGALIPSNVQRYKWTKLELDKVPSGESIKISRELSEATDRKPVEIIANFLSHVKEQLIKNLDRQYGQAVWRTLPITLVVTVPAVWSDAAKDSTLQAVRNAGFQQLSFPMLKRTILVTEPEAAAIYTIQSLRGSVQDQQFAIGDGFIVCDMGGGTVDLVSYRIAGLDPTALEEATIGNGDQCGGSFVERGFLKWLERRLGTTDFIAIAGHKSEDLPRTSYSAKLSRMLQDFIFEAKSGFSGTEDNFLRLPPPVNAVVDDGPRDMQEMFEFPLRRTYELLLEQMKQSRISGKVQIKYVFMVGGFSESPYMFEKIKNFVEAHGLQAIRPAYAWSAIVRGAAVKGLEGDGRTPIKNRKCRRHYGTDCTSLFVSGKHREGDSYICPYTGGKRAANQMSWLLRKGQDLSTMADSHASYSFVQNFWQYEKRTACMELLACDGDRAPQRCKDPVDLSGVPHSAFQIHTTFDGRRYYSLGFEVEISVQSSLEFSFVVDGVRYGSVTAKYT